MTLPGRVESLGGSAAVRVLAPGPGTPFPSREDVHAAVLEHGAVQFRGFELPVPVVARLARMLLPRIHVTPVHRGHHPLHRVLQTTTPGTQPMPLHAEYSHMPGRVELMLFHCERPGGDTLLCDGVALWNALADATRAYFREHQVTFRTWHDAAAWHAACGTTEVDEVRRASAHVPGYVVEAGPLGGLLTSWTTRAVTRTLRGEETLAVNIFPGAYAALEVSPIPRDVMDDVARAAQANTIALDWQPGDLLLLDNTRYLHGRTEQAAYRRTWVVLGFLRP